MRAKLFSQSGKTKGILHRIADEATLGRRPENTIPVNAKRISGHHARIYLDRDQNCYLLEDLDSLNGTALDGVAVKGTERLGHLNVVTLAGDYDFIFQDLHLCARRHSQGASAQAAAASDTGVHSEALALPSQLLNPSGASSAVHTQVDAVPMGVPEALSPALPEDVAPPLKAPVQLVVRYPEGNVARIPLAEGENLVGRAFEAQVQIDRREVSRRHATLTVRGTAVRVRDEGSANHTFVDGKRIDAEVEVPIEAKLRFGTIKAELAISEETGGRGQRGRQG